ncbi:hypothetical protein L208DRAFT_1464471 [Tricholoma matsutake]|nr:hypothetical protein L208DRAFT_1464471 [Tricholoma matsutake 945]
MMTHSSPKGHSSHPDPSSPQMAAWSTSIEKILDKHTHGHGHQYLVQWLGYRPEHDLWLPQSELIDTKALQNYKTSSCQQ